MTGAGRSTIGQEHAAYLPRFLPAWAEQSSGLAHREVDASLVMFDITGFTRLTERLSRQGRAGAEELSEVLDAVFSPLVTAAEQEGADLLKWGGDAVLMLVDGVGHATRAARATVEMQRVLARVGHLSTSVGRVVLRASSGIHSGTTHLVLAGDPTVHRELIVLGPAASAVCRVDSSAEGGQIVVSDATARLLPPAMVGAAMASGRLLTPPRAGPPAPRAAGSPSDFGVELVASLLPPQLRTHLAHAHEPEHRVVTAAFVLFDGTDQLLLDRGADHLALAVDELVRNVQDAVSRHGVSFHESDIRVGGGAFMLVAGAPLSTGDDVDHLVSAVRHIVDSGGEIPVRAGIAQGRVFTGDLGPPSRRTYSVKGHAVNLAARLAAKAVHGEVLAPTGLLQHAHRGFDVEPHAALALKGVAHPVGTVAVGAAHESDRPTAATVMVGRDAELDILTDALDRLGGEAPEAIGPGGVVEIVGDPGIGKSRLVTEALSAAEDFVTLTAAGDRVGVLTPYRAARQLLSEALDIRNLRDRAVAASRVRDHVSRVAPELSGRLPLLGAILDVDLTVEGSEVEALDEQFRTEALEQLVVDLLVASLREPVVLVVEDTHLLDRASGGILDRIAAETSGRPWLLITTRREAEAGWRSPAELRIELGPLSASASRMLTDVVTPDNPLPPATAEALARRAGGHPLFLRELALAAARGDHLGEPPESVEELVAVQLDALPGQDRALLRRAAVLGNTFSLRLLGRMLDVPAAPPTKVSTLRRALDRLEGFVVAEGPGRMAFRHTVHREVAYAGLPFRTRSALHVRAAEVLEESADLVASRPELLALHYLAGGRFEEAWRYARRAGERANERFSPAAAAEAYEQAAEAARRSAAVPDEERARDLESLGDAHFLCGRSEGADAAYHQASRAAGHTAVESARLMLKRAKVAQRQGRYQLALRRLTIGLQGVETDDHSESTAYRARLLARRAVVLMSQGRYLPARDAAQEAVAAATAAAGEIDALAQAELVLHGVHMFTATPDVDHHGEVALRLFEELGDLGGQAHALNNLAILRLHQGKWNDALAMYARAAEMFRRVGDATNEANAAYNLAELLGRQGRYAEAMSQLDTVMRVARGVGDEELVGLVLREQGRALSRRGRREGLDLLTSARRVLAGLGEPHEVTDTDIALAEAHLLAGRQAEALASVGEAIEVAGSIGAATLLPSAHRVRAAALLELDDLPGAEHALAEGLRLSSAPEVAHERGFLLVVAARHALLRERSESRSGDSPIPRPPSSSPSSAHLTAQARLLLDSLGVVSAPLPWADGQTAEPAHG